MHIIFLILFSFSTISACNVRYYENPFDGQFGFMDEKDDTKQASQSMTILDRDDISRQPIPCYQSHKTPNYTITGPAYTKAYWPPIAIAIIFVTFVYTQLSKHR